METLGLLKQKLDKNEECSELVTICISLHSNDKRNKKGLTTLLLRYYIKNNETEKIKQIIFNQELMRRDYLSCLDYFIKLPDTYDIISYIYTMIIDIEEKDVDLMIEKGWSDLLKKFDGMPITTSYPSNIHDTKILSRYYYDVSIMRDKYIERIKDKDNLDAQLINVNVLIDGANMAHLGGEFDFSCFPKFIKLLEKMGYTPKIILHERHIITDEYVIPYLIRTPMLRNDDDYLIYGMLKTNTFVLSNDMFRDHLKNMDIYTKAYVYSMTMRYRNNRIIIPTHTKCIQVVGDDIYIPSNKGSFFKYKKE
jgi:hypothetical protein